MRFTLLIANLLSLNTFAGIEFKRIVQQFQLISSEKQSDLTSFESIYLKFEVFPTISLLLKSTIALMDLNRGLILKITRLK